MGNINRKEFLNKAAIGTAGILLVPSLVIAQNNPPIPPQPPKGPPLNKELVKEFVIIAHRDFDKLKLMLKETPDLLNSSYSWNDWDWEDALGAAGHMGFRDMALFLLEQGARPTIHVAAMLGHLEVVKSFITAFPQMKTALGPHKLTLMHHAEKGGKHARKVVKYLKSAGFNA
jgi:hypothetical protein